MEQAFRQHGFKAAALGPLHIWPQTLAILIATSILAILLQPLLQGEVSSGLIFVLGITLVGASSGLVPALLCALAAAIVFNFFLADPVLTFRISKGDDLAPPVIFTLCALISGVLSGRLRDRTSQLGKTNLQLESLLNTSGKIQAAADVSAIQDALRETVLGKLNFRVFVFENIGGRSRAVDPDADQPRLLQIADRLIAGREVVKQDDVVGHRLEGSRACVGALIAEVSGKSKVDAAFLKALASLVGLALERAQFAEVLAEAEANLRAEGLKSALLSSVSHDLRTPLTTISASASSLINYGTRLDDETSQRMLHGIVEECDRLNRFTANLLEMSRLQTSANTIEGQVLSASDVVRSAIRRTRQHSAGHKIDFVPWREDIFVKADTALFELALLNVLENACQYSPNGTTIHVGLARQGDSCVIEVSDQGCGIPAKEQARVFDRFYRVRRTDPMPQGSGLGLAIAKGFVEAFHGSIGLVSPVFENKGTLVMINLPVVEAEGA
ncbi:MAG: DUF4118 domain-containing protein [Novosphingobium sp.]|nr:DUF4118 domain-containing protein [Novosphingobium sp.]